MILTTLIFLSGLFAWTLLEYIIHGVLAHSHRTFVTPLHNEHHVDPRAVFAMRAYIPTAIVLIVLLTIFGMAPGMIFLFGIVAGFAVYEYRALPDTFRDTSELRLRHGCGRGIWRII